MAAGHDVLRRLLEGRAGSTNWEHLRAALRQVTRQRSPESEAVLRGLLSRDFRVRLEAGSPAPHAMSAEDMLRSEAIQVLGRWDYAKHRRLIERAARRAASPLLVEVARATAL